MYLRKVLVSCRWTQERCLAGSPEPQSISRKPGSIDRVLPAARFLEARNSAENKICWHIKGAADKEI